MFFKSAVEEHQETKYDLRLEQSTSTNIVGTFRFITSLFHLCLSGVFGTTSVSMNNVYAYFKTNFEKKATKS
jgi:hypothetical protein